MVFGKMQKAPMLASVLHLNFRNLVERWMFTSMTDWFPMFLQNRIVTFTLYRVFYMLNFAYGKWNYKRMQQPEGRVKL
mgnify:CR=1 FL=1